MTQAVTIPIPSPVNSLEAYVAAVNRFPILSQEDEHELATRLKRDGDIEAAKALVLSHLRLVVSVARGYMGYGLPQADLIQEGNVGLMKAVRRFDPERGVRLVSFAIHWIKAEIHEFILRNWRIVKVATTKAQRKLFFNLRSLRSGLGAMGQDEVHGVARELGVKAEEVREMETRLGGQDVPLEPPSDEGEPGFGPIAYLASPAAEPLQEIEAEQTARREAEGLERALQSLDERSRRIIEARWLRESDTATLHELAAEYKVSAERIRQIEQKAMQKMRTVIDAAR